jgi:ABC-2 type transport system permease protein
VLRYGLGAENLAWVAIFAVAPVSAIYYPVSVLPDWLRVIANALPSSHVFEGMRAALIDHTFRTDQFFTAVGLNVIYLSLGIAVFLYVFRSARRRGLLLNIGE